MGGGSKITSDKTSKNPLNVYYFGDAPLNIMNDVSIVGNLLVEQANINFGNGGRINGAIISGGDQVKISGGSINKTIIIIW